MSGKDFLKIEAYFPPGYEYGAEKNIAACLMVMDEPFAGNDVFNREDFYRVLLGILEPEETILLSTHLIEEVERLIGRAVLLRKGRIAGDIGILELEEQGRTLMEYVKEAYGYRSDRVSRTLGELTDGEKPE